MDVGSFVRLPCPRNKFAATSPIHPIRAFPLFDLGLQHHVAESLLPFPP